MGYRRPGGRVRKRYARHPALAVLRWELDDALRVRAGLGVLEVGVDDVPRRGLVCLQARHRRLCPPGVSRRRRRGRVREARTRRARPALAGRRRRRCGEHERLGLVAVR
jgi:hypothetical protein